MNEFDFVQKDIERIDNDIKNLKKDINDNFEDILLSLDNIKKPQFTNLQVISFFVGVIVYAVIIATNIQEVRSMAESNSNSLKKQDIILDKVNAIQVDVAVFKSKCNNDK